MVIGQSPNAGSIARLALIAVVPFLLCTLFIFGCGKDETKPQLQLDVMGVIMMDQTQPAGGPYQVGVVVSVDGQLVTDATVQVNDFSLQFKNDPQYPEQTGYVGLMSVTPGQAVTVTVTSSAGTKTMQATAPGLVEITSPTIGTPFADAEDIPLAWNPATGATVCAVTCASSSTTAPGTWLLAPTASSFSVPGSATTPPGCRVNVISLNGSGTMPTMNLQEWLGKTGFWVGSQDWVDVIVAP